VKRFVVELVARVRRAGATGALTVRAASGFYNWDLINTLLVGRHRRGCLQVRAGLIVDSLVETRSVHGAAVLEGIGTFQEAIDGLS
jgi:PII-like signaling protein